MKVCPIPDAVVELPVLAGRNSVQGTATCLVEPAVALLDEFAVPEVGAEVPVLPVVGELAVPVEPLSEMTAKSTLPELGLMMTSLMVPTDSPELDFTSALVS